MLCSCESDPTEPPVDNSPNIRVDFSYVSNNLQQNAFYAEVWTLTDSSWTPDDLGFSFDGTEMTLEPNYPTHTLKDGKYTNKWRFNLGTPTLGISYDWTLTVDTTTKGADILFRPNPAIDNLPDNDGTYYNPTLAGTLTWNIGSLEPDPTEQVVYYEYTLSGTQRRSKIVEPTDRSWVIEPNEIISSLPWPTGMMFFSVEMSREYGTIAGSKISYAQIAVSTPRPITFATPPPATPIFARH